MSGLARLWAGWRGAYVSGVSDPSRASDPFDRSDPSDPSDPSSPESCVLCRITGADENEPGAVVWRGPRIAAVLNAYPYTSGHLMVAPRRHVGELEQLDGDEARELWAAVTDAVRALKAAYRPEGINVGLNLGRAAGAGVPGHLHVHALPRWNGDTNFMTSVAEARVLPEALSDTWKKLRDSWPS